MKMSKAERKAFNQGKAIGYAEGYVKGYKEGNPFNALIATYAHYIKDGTPYEERLHGEWIWFKGGYYKCDKCGEVERAKKNFCSNCGADMRKEEEE